MAELNITIGFSTTNKWISRIIRWVTRAPCSHAWIAYDDDALGQRMVLQAELWGYEVRPWHRWKRQNIWVAEFIPAGPPLDDALREIAQFIGTDYDVRSALWAGTKRWLRRLFPAIRAIRTPSSFMCSEAVVRFLRFGHSFYKTVIKGLDPEGSSPGDLLVSCRESYRELRALDKPYGQHT